MTPKILTESYFLSASEANAEQELSLPILTSKLIDIATAHANALGVGNPAMGDINAGWVLSRLTIELLRYPKVNETYSISTWIESTNRHFSQRAFKISSGDGETLGYARSIWMVINTIDHSNVGLSHLYFDPQLIDGTIPPIEKQERHSEIISDDEATEESAKGKMVASEPVFEYRFKYCDLDFYRHVNTVRYVSLLLNRFSLEEHDDFMVSRLELSFMHEAKYGMETQLLRKDCNDSLTSSFLLRKKEDKSPLFFARMFRKPRVLK